MTGWGKIAAVTSILATAYFLIAAVAAHLVMTQYDFFRDYISDYAVGPWGWIYGSAFLASAVGCLALAASVVLLVPSQALSKAGVVLLVLVGFTYVIDFAFPTDILPPGAPPKTDVGVIHLLDALVGWVFFVFGSVLISSRLNRIGYWKAWQPLLTILAWLSALLLVVLVGVVISKAPYGGLAEKLFILDRNLWALSLGVLVLIGAGVGASRDRLAPAPIGASCPLAGERHRSKEYRLAVFRLSKASIPSRPISLTNRASGSCRAGADSG